MEPEWIWRDWGIFTSKVGRQWYVCYGDPRRYVASGIYRNRRRAKKEVWYISNGCYRGPFHGAYRYINGKEL